MGRLIAAGAQVEAAGTSSENKVSAVVELRRVIGALSVCRAASFIPDKARKSINQVAFSSHDDSPRASGFLNSLLVAGRSQPIPAQPNP